MDFEYWDGILARPDQRSPHTDPALRTGVDTVRLVADFRVIVEKPELVVYRDRRATCPAYSRDVLLWETPIRGPTYGMTAVWKSDIVQARISRSNRCGGPVKCWVTFSVPRVLYGHNALPPNRKGLYRALQAVEDLLRDIGLEVDLEWATLSRLDTCCNRAPPRPFDDYREILRTIDPPHTKWRCEYHNGLMCGNKSTQWCWYDKREEMRFREKGNAQQFEWAGTKGNRPAFGEKDLPPGNSLRCEYRLRKAAAVQRHLGIKTVHELLHRYDELGDFLDRKLAQNWFGKTAPDGKPTPVPVPTNRQAQWEWQLAEVAENPGRIRDLLLLKGYEDLARDFDANELNTLLRKTYGCKPSGLNKLRQALQAARFRSLTSLGLSYSELFSELREACLMKRIPVSLRVIRGRLPLPGEMADNDNQDNFADNLLENFDAIEQAQPQRSRQPA